MANYLANIMAVVIGVAVLVVIVAPFLIWESRALFDRRLLRFRLRTLLLVFSAVQTGLALTIWWHQRTRQIAPMLATLAGVGFLGWVVLCMWDDFFGKTPSRRWKRMVRPGRIDGPPRPRGPEPPPRQAQGGKRPP